MFLRSLTRSIVFFAVVTSLTVRVSSQPAIEDAAKAADAFLTQWDKADMPGCAVGAVRDGKVVYKRGFGMANLDFDIPNTSTTRFNLASVSKAFTAASIVLLAQQGKLKLDDDVRKYVPEMPAYSEPITLRHMLHHTSGIREYQALTFFGGGGPDDPISDKKVLGMITRQKATSFKPGTKYQYSNSNYHLLGMIVARVSGMSLRAFAEENIFKPLGMKNTMFFDNRNEIVKNRASGYSFTPEKKLKVRVSLFDIVGGGGVLSTVEDLLLWEQNFHDAKVGGPELVKLLTTPGTLTTGDKMTYAMGMWAGQYRGLPVVRHSGNMTGYRAQILSFPEHKFAAVALCNNFALSPPTIVNKFADIYLEGLLKPVAAPAKVDISALPAGSPLTEKEAAVYAGIFANAGSGMVFRMTMKDGKLFQNGLAKGQAEVKRAGDRLVMVEGDSRFEMIPVVDAGGKVTAMKLPRAKGEDMFVLVRPPFDTAEKLAEYAGSYYSDELAAVWTVFRDGNTIKFKIGEGFESPPLTPAYEDVFAAADGQIYLNFTRDSTGKVNAIVFNSALDEREVKGVILTKQTAATAASAR